MRKIPKNNIIPQMFDVRPVDQTGDLDWEKINSVERVSSLREEDVEPEQDDAEIVQFGKTVKSDEVPVFFESTCEGFKEEPAEAEEEKNEIPEIENIGDGSERKFIFNEIAFSFSAVILIIVVSLGVISLAGKGISIKDKVLGVSNKGYANLATAVESVKGVDFKKASSEFTSAYENFLQASEDIDEIGGVLVDVTRFIPALSKVSSGKHAVSAGKHLAAAGKSINDVMGEIYDTKNSSGAADETKSLLEIYREAEEKLKSAEAELVLTNEDIGKIKIDDLPADKQNEFLLLKSKLSVAVAGIDKFLDNSHIFIDILGGNGPRKYLFLFQNNHEIRATGGFVGSYGLLDIQNGNIKKFFIDGIFNPDGQLKDKIIPPKPIQKISVRWSLHDSNWFPDFPLSAEKAILFYEKTGGPTVDGVITFTPTIMEKFLEITGPITMEEYGVTLDAGNFVEKTQYEVEVDYDKEENKPKKILGDLAPIVLDKLANTKDIKNVSMTIEAILSGLAEKHILIYSSNKEIQELVSGQGWSGEILDTSKDYLSVINTNINGYKTDGVIEEKIDHLAEIAADGSIVDTVTVTRKHPGGNYKYEWWNKVNADYMRIYVPKGSVLLEVEGQTREISESLLDYKALGFKEDADVSAEEKNMSIDEKSGTRIYEDAGKTVFANWAYVSPQETVVVKYKYMLPFKINFDNNTPAGSYSLLLQKQSGSKGSQYSSEISYPENWNTNWHYPEDSTVADGKINTSGKLDVDRFTGAVFTQKAND